MSVNSESKNGKLGKKKIVEEEQSSTKKKKVSSSWTIQATESQEGPELSLKKVATDIKRGNSEGIDHQLIGEQNNSQRRVSKSQGVKKIKAKHSDEVLPSSTSTSSRRKSQNSKQSPPPLLSSSSPQQLTPTFSPSAALSSPEKIRRSEPHVPRGQSAFHGTQRIHCAMLFIQQFYEISL